MNAERNTGGGSGLLILALFIIFVPGLVALLFAVFVGTAAIALAVATPIVAVAGAVAFSVWLIQRRRFAKELTVVNSLPASDNIFERQRRQERLDNARPTIPTRVAFGGLAAALLVGAMAVTFFTVQNAETAKKEADAAAFAQRVASVVDVPESAVISQPKGVYVDRGGRSEFSFCTDQRDPKPLNPDTHVIIPLTSDCFSVWTVEELARAEAYDAEYEMAETAQYVLGDLAYVHDAAVGPDNTLFVLMPEYEANGAMRDPGFQARLADAHLTAQVSGNALVFTFPAEKGGEL
ncbi:hypothetical protein AS96_13075 [Microbacterium sp. MRS-1]|nr:hypothetical protein AS96_13075 [Microbacterium sp. MRS-1]